MQFKPSLTPLLPPPSTLAVLVTLVAIHCSVLLPFLSKLTAPPFAPFAPFAPQPPSPLQISPPACHSILWWSFIPPTSANSVTPHACKLQPSLIEPEFLPPIWSGRGWFLRVAFKTTMTCFDDHLLRSIFCYRCVADALRWCVVIKTCFSTDSEVVPQIVILFFPVPEQTDNCTEGGERQQIEDLWTGFVAYSPPKKFDRYFIEKKRYFIDRSVIYSISADILLIRVL